MREAGAEVRVNNIKVIPDTRKTCRKQKRRMLRKKADGEHMQETQSTGRGEACGLIQAKAGGVIKNKTGNKHTYGKDLFQLRCSFPSLIFKKKKKTAFTS